MDRYGDRLRAIYRTYRRKGSKAAGTDLWRFLEEILESGTAWRVDPFTLGLTAFTIGMEDHDMGEFGAFYERVRDEFVKAKGIKPDWK